MEQTRAVKKGDGEKEGGKEQEKTIREVKKGGKTEQKKPALSEEKKGNGEPKVSSVPKEDDIVESIEPGAKKVKESDKELYKMMMKDGVHTFPFEMLDSDEEDEEEEV